MKKIIIVSILSLILVGCHSSKVYRLLQKGSVIQTEFKKEIPFEMRMGLIFLKVDIKGKTYDFLLDTGAPNVASYELAHELGLTARADNKIRDSQGKTKITDFTFIDTISISGIQFINTGAAIMDVNESTTLACMELDGIIGANLMKYAIWQFDYQKQILTLTSSIDSLIISDSVITVPFNTKNTGTPVVDIKMDSNIIQKNVTLDMGSNGDIRFRNKTYENLKENKLIKSHKIGYGYLSSGIFGHGDIDTTDFFKIQNLSFGEVHLQNQIYSSSRTKSSSTIGTKFFKNYILTVRWDSNQMLLDPVSTYDRSEIYDFGFRINYESGQLSVGYIYAGSTAEQMGLTLGDLIVQIDDVNYTNCTSEQWCDLLLSKVIHRTKPMTIIILRDNKKMKFVFEKELFLE